MLSRKNKGLIRFLLITLLVSSLYSITGYFGLGFATGSPYSTAIWIPSGIALGAALVFGLDALPGVFLGSLIVNYIITSIGGYSTLEFAPLVVGVVIALGAFLQAYVGFLLIRRWIGLSNNLNEPNDILLFAFLSGPISCLLNATTSNIALVLLDIIPIANLPQSWITWYLGDSIGVLIFTPIFLILFAKPHAVWRSRIIPVLLPLCASFFIVSFAYAVVKQNNMLTDQLWFVLVCGFLFCVLVNITLFIIQGQKNLMQLELKEVLRSAGECIFSVDQNEKIVFANPAAEKMWGQKSFDIIGRSIHDYIRNINTMDDSAHEKDCPIYAAFKYNKKSNTTNELLFRSDGSSFWVEYTCTPLIISQKTKGAVIILNDISKRREAEFQLERLAHHDALTGLPNRISFIKKLKNSIHQMAKGDGHLSVCFLDLDNFKNINDNLGHDAGDIALQQISSIISGNIGETDYFARLGGDEFAIILYNKERDEVNAVVEKIINSINQPVRVKRTEVNLSISIGVATYPEAGKTGNELIKNADIAMYRAKYSGKNTYIHFNEDLSKAIRRQHVIVAELRNALLRNEFTLCYQPQIETTSSKITGLEVLLRWSSPTLGDVSPSEFIPIAEREGLIHVIGEWVLRQLSVEYKILSAELSSDLMISMNVSVLQLGDPRFYNSLVKVMDDARLSNKLILEVTETALMINPVETIDQMQDISKLGVKFSLDDFGVNYSSMRYLKNLPISQIKIDYIFIKDICVDNNDYAIVNTIIQLSNGLGIPVVAEGVESKEQFELLFKMGCKYVQGFYFYQPMSLRSLLVTIKGCFT